MGIFQFWLEILYAIFKLATFIFKTSNAGLLHPNLVAYLMRIVEHLHSMKHSVGLLISISVNKFVLHSSSLVYLALLNDECCTIFVLMFNDQN